MEKDRGTKIIAIIALCVAVIGLSVGFAAFSNNLTISSSANVSPESTDFDVNFSTVNTAETAGAVSGVVSHEGIVTADDATINNTGDPTITGLNANFTEPGQSVTYTFYTHNAGKYIAYLNSVTYADVSGKTTSKVCTPAKGTDDTMVDNACAAISVTVKVGSDKFTGSQASISNHSLAIEGYEPVEVKIEYASDGARTDGDFSVAFGDISLTYGSVD